MACKKREREREREREGKNKLANKLGMKNILASR